MLPGRLDEAAAALREALRLDPGYANAHANLGSLYIITGEPDAARSCFLKAAQSGPAKHAFAELMLGALERSTDPSAAAGHFTATLAALDYPNHPVIWTPFERAEIQALALAALGRTQEVTTVFERAVPHRSAADVYQRQRYELFTTPTPPPCIYALIEIWRNIIATDPTAAPYGAPPLP